MQTQEYPEVLIPRKSPTGVYIQAREYIEGELAKKCNAMQDRYRKAKDLCASECTAKMVRQKGTRLLQEGNAQEKVWLEFIKRKAEMEENKDSLEKKPSDEKESKLAEQLKLTPMWSITWNVIADDYVPCPLEALVSFTAFQTGVEDWMQNAARNIKLSRKYESVQESFGLPASFHGKDISKECLTLDRLVRTFRGTFVVSTGEHKERFDKCLVRVDSAFMENVILIKGAGSGRQIPVRSVYVMQKSGATMINSRFEPQDLVVYLDISVEFVLSALNETMAEVSGIYDESRDDII